MLIAEPPLSALEDLTVIAPSLALSTPNAIHGLGRKSPPTSVHSLPNELLLHVFSYLRDHMHPTRHLLSVMLVSRVWHAVATSVLWRRLEIRRHERWETIRQQGTVPRYGHFVHALSLYSASFSTRDHETIVAYCRNLRTVRLEKCRNLSASFLRDLVRYNCGTLEELVVYGPGIYESLATEISDDLLIPMLPYCGKLRVLRILSAAVTDRLLAELAATEHPWERLTTIDLTECGRITAFGLAELFAPDHFPVLRDLRLQHRDENHIDVDFFEMLATNFPRHRFCIVVTNWYIQFNGIHTFVKISEDLKSLDKRMENVTLDTYVSGRALW